ncbi:hypothetical protein BCR43DRAFT_488155 [Syncephalastrum racemosum]|uniref:Uncharacterized protein n=1 Tax=Syncephalastrum racemosum TaxID=13706 RepID=A0A1X2HI82_SYNRA|nr:hypothetical protein BCR43DRAFT_488155 [Syncephalastrum racemosum]
MVTIIAPCPKRPSSPRFAMTGAASLVDDEDACLELRQILSSPKWRSLVTTGVAEQHLQQQYQQAQQHQQQHQQQQQQHQYLHHSQLDKEELEIVRTRNPLPYDSSFVPNYASNTLSVSTTRPRSFSVGDTPNRHHSRLLNTAY